MTAPYEDFSRLISAARRDHREPRSQRTWRSGLRLPDIYAPSPVQACVKIHCNPGQTTGFITCPSSCTSEPQPSPRNQQPLLPIDVKSLPLVPAPNSPRSFEFSVVFISITVRKYV